MLELCMWIIVHLGAALGALLVIALWAFIIFVTVDEAVALFRGDDTNTQDGDPR